MSPQELLPPPPKKNISIGGELLPPPPKKKDEAGSNNGATPSDNGSSGTPKVEVAIDPISQSLQADELSKKVKSVGETNFETGQVSTTIPDEDAQKQSQLLKDNIKSQGYDADKLAKDFNGIPESVLQQPGFTKDELLDRYKNNPQQYERNIASAKGQSALKEELYKLPNGHELFANVVNDYNNADVGDYTQKRENVRRIIQTANQFGGDKKDEIIKNIGIDFSNLYGKEASNMSSIEKDPLSKTLNNTQVVAQHFLEDTSPKELNKYKSALLDDKDVKDNVELKLQKQEAGRRLEEIGNGLSKSYAQEHLNPILREYTALQNKASVEGLSTEEQLHLTQLEQAGKPYADILESLKKDESTIANRYPMASYLDANNFAQELVGQTHTGLGWLAAETGKATENTAKGVWDLVSEPFRSEQNSNLHQAEILGGSALTDNSAYLKQSNQTTKNFKPELSKELQLDVDKIKNDEALSSDQKIKQVSDLLMNRSGEWRRTPIEGGETNIGLASLMYGVGGLAANLAPFIAGDLLTGGGANAGLLRKFTSTFTSAAATSFHDTYVNALNKGVENPFAYAARVTAINSAAMAGADAPSAIKKMLGNTSAIGKMVNKMDDASIMAALKEEPKALGAFKKSLDVVKATGKAIGSSAIQGFKTGAKVASITTGGQAINDAIDNELKSPADYAKNAAIETLKFGILGTGLGAIGKIGEKPSALSLASISEAGKNPEPFHQALNQMEKDGSITPENATQVRNNIDKVSKIFKSSPILNNPSLTESAKREYLYNALVKNDAMEAAKSLPSKQAAQAEHTAMVSDFKNDLILQPKTTDQLESRKNALNKILEPKKDESGKPVELNEKIEKETKAELQAINEVQEENSSKVADENAKRLLKKAAVVETIQPAVKSEEVNPEITKLEQERDQKINDISKPKLQKLEYIPESELVKQKNETELIEQQRDIKKRESMLKQLIECLTKQ